MFRPSSAGECLSAIRTQAAGYPQFSWSQNCRGWSISLFKVTLDESCLLSLFSYLLWPAWTAPFSILYAPGQLLGDDVRLSWLGRLVVDFWGSCCKVHERRLKAAFKIKINDFSTFQNILIKRIRTLLVQAGFWEWDVMFSPLSAWIFLHRRCLSSVRRKWQII